MARCGTGTWRRVMRAVVLAWIVCAPALLEACDCDSSHDETCTCCDGTSVVISVCDDCMYLRPPCEAACDDHASAPPMCASDAGSGGDATSSGDP